MYKKNSQICSKTNVFTVLVTYISINFRNMVNQVTAIEVINLLTLTEKYFLDSIFLLHLRYIVCKQETSPMAALLCWSWWRAPDIYHFAACILLLIEIPTTVFPYIIYRPLNLFPLSIKKMWNIVQTKQK